MLGSLLIGALTHLAWDGFTHASGAGVQAVGVLHAQLFSIGRYPVFVYKLLQHTSTLMGIALLTAWVWRWLEQAPVQRLDPTPPCCRGSAQPPQS